MFNAVEYIAEGNQAVVWPGARGTVGFHFMLKAQNWRFHSITIRFRTTYSYIHRVSLLSSYFDFFFLPLFFGLDGRRNILGIFFRLRFSFTFLVVWGD